MIKTDFFYFCCNFAMQGSILTHHRAAKQYAPPTTVEQDISMVQPRSECFWCGGAGDGFIAAAISVL